jgi:hypothetical protein
VLGAARSPRRWQQLPLAKNRRPARSLGSSKSTRWEQRQSGTSRCEDLGRGRQRHRILRRPPDRGRPAAHRGRGDARQRDQLLLFLRAPAASVALLATSRLSLTVTLSSAEPRRMQPLRARSRSDLHVPFAAAVLLLVFGADYNLFTVGHVWKSAPDRPLQRTFGVHRLH